MESRASVTHCFVERNYAPIKQQRLHVLSSKCKCCLHPPTPPTHAGICTHMNTRAAVSAFNLGLREGKRQPKDHLFSYIWYLPHFGAPSASGWRGSAEVRTRPNVYVRKQLAQRREHMHGSTERNALDYSLSSWWRMKVNVVEFVYRRDPVKSSLYDSTHYCMRALFHDMSLQSAQPWHKDLMDTVGGKKAGLDYTWLFLV